MTPKQKLLRDSGIIVLSVTLALYIAYAGIAYTLVETLRHLRWFSIILAGAFYTSLFTSAPAVIILGEFALSTNLLVLAILGGIGAMLGDYLIFHLMRNNFTEHCRFVTNRFKNHRIARLWKSRQMKFLLPIIGLIIIASPLPDEIGIAMLGLSCIKNRTFFILSFFLNSAGIYLIGLLAREVAGIL